MNIWKTTVRLSSTYSYRTNYINVIPAGIAGIQNTGMCYSERMEKQPCVYILASRPNGTLYIGVTSNLIGRVYQHRQNLITGFTQRYDVHNLVWYEPHEQMETAILREKQLKNWSRIAKKRLIELDNPCGKTCRLIWNCHPWLLDPGTNPSGTDLHLPEGLRAGQPGVIPCRDDELHC